jgi:hypothetical protein
MTDRRKERDRARRKRRKAREADERRREERNRRFDELVEAWRRNHPGEHEEDRKDRPTRGRMFFWPQPHQMHKSHRGPWPSRWREATGRNGGQHERRRTRPIAASRGATDGRT